MTALLRAFRMIRFVRLRLSRLIFNRVRTDPGKFGKYLGNFQGLEKSDHRYGKVWKNR